MKFATIISSLFGTYEDIPAVVVNDEGQGLIRGPPTSGVVVNEQKRLTSKQKGVLVGSILLFATVALKMGGRGEGEGGKTPADPAVDFLQISEDTPNTCHIYDTSISDKMNDNINYGYGVLSRFRYDGDDTEDGQQLKCDKTGSKLCGVVGTYLHNDIVTPNPVYNVNDDGTGVGKGATVIYAFIDAWSMNGGDLQAYAYFPTDSNGIDKRNWRENDGGTGLPGQGCHWSQNFVYNKDSKKIGDLGYATLDDYACKCNFDFYDPAEWGKLVWESTQTVSNPEENGFYGDDHQMDQKQCTYRAHDYAACWVTDNDFKLVQNMNLIIDAQNSLYNTRNTWWAGGAYKSCSGPKDPLHYQGHNEVSVHADMDDINKFEPEAMIVVLPTTLDTICDLNKGLAQQLDTDLLRYHDDGYGIVPVVVMKVKRDGGDKFKKTFFTQDYKFASGNCIKLVGKNKVAYYWAGPQKKYC